ncbi:MAG: hypothetical protein FJ078_05060 [Cyanobacteria bacterium K_DeepCast_35m_m2_155]|nr:hypothetical protein [Cyanobacteria bacterium K_DeepCast_35m_m2_155]
MLRLAVDSFQQHLSRRCACQGGGNSPATMSITHCPLCIGLAVLSALRFMAHAVMLWSLKAEHPITLRAPARGLRPAVAHG